MFAFLSGTAPSATTDIVDSVMIYIVGISVVLLVGVTAAMIYFVFKYHRKKGHKPKDIHGNLWLEILWIGIPTVLVLSMFYYGYLGFSQIRHIPEDAFQIDVTARMWAWEFNYPNGKKTDSLYVPVGKPIKLNMESADVNHSLYIPAFRVKEDVIAGRKNYLSFTVDEPGYYDIACAEYCGLKHSMMYTAVIGMEEKDWLSWYEDNDTTSSDTLAISEPQNETASLEPANLNLLRTKGCMTCHTIDGSEKLAPSFKGLVGNKKIVITDGDQREVIVDEEYLRRSILYPNVDIVEGYAVGMMPSQRYNLNDEEILKIIETIKSIN